MLSLELVGACHCGSDASGGAGGPDAGAPEAADGDVAVVDGDSSTDRTDAPETGDDDGTTTWWDDPATWSPVPGGERCNLYRADPEKAKVQPRVWTSCGPGCLEAPANLMLPTPNRVNRQKSSGASIGEEIYFRYTGGWNDKPLSHIARVSDGATIALVGLRDSASCSYVSYGQGAALLLPLADDGHHVMVGWVPPGAPALITWSEHWIAIPPLRTLFFGWTAGWAIASQDATVRGVDSAAAVETTVLAQGSGPVFYGEGRGDMAIWSMYNSTTQRTTLRGYASGGEASEIVSQDASIGGVGMSDDRMAWVGRHGPQLSVGLFDAVELYWSPRTADPSKVQVHQGPSLPANCGLLAVAVGGDYAATRGCALTGSKCDACSVFVAQLSSNKVWKIPMRPGKFMADVLAANSSEVLLGEFDYPGVAGEEGTYRRLVRLEFSHLDELEHAW